MEKSEKSAVGLVVLAAGSALRFGENKLLAPFRGTPLLRRALDAVPRERLERCAVVTRFASCEAMARERGFVCLRNDRPDLGQSHSVRLGVEALGKSCGALVFLVADQPLLRRESVERLLRAHRDAPERIVVLAHEGRFGNPVLFPQRYYPELLSLTGDRGGRALLRAHPEAVLTVEAGAEELLDVDTAQELAALERAYPPGSGR